MKKIGLTGGIGSGKSTVARIFASLGYQVYEADVRAKILMTGNADLIAGVKELFGKEAYLPDGQLDRGFIAGIVFQDPQKLQQLNNLVHPATGRDFLEWVKGIPADYSLPFVLKEAAILFESGAYKASDAVISVYASKQLRLQRVQARDGATAGAVLARMDKQWSEQEKMRRADFVIYNDGRHFLTEQVLAAIRYFQ